MVAASLACSSSDSDDSESDELDDSLSLSLYSNCTSVAYPGPTIGEEMEKAELKAVLIYTNASASNWAYDATLAACTEYTSIPRRAHTAIKLSIFMFLFIDILN